MLRFVVLGSGTGVADADRGPAGFVVEVGDQRWLVDGGSGTLQRAARAGIDVTRLAGVFYTHRHPDHCADFIPLLFAMKLAKRDQPLAVWATATTQTLLAAQRELSGIKVPGLVQHAVAEGGPWEVRLGELTVRARPAQHVAGAVHYRFEAQGRAVVYSGDTGPSAGLVELARGADLLVVECAGSDEAPIPGHLTPTTVATLVAAARPREVWLTHLYPGVDADQAMSFVRKVGVPVHRAADGDHWSSSPEVAGPAEVPAALRQEVWDLVEEWWTRTRPCGPIEEIELDLPGVPVELWHGEPDEDGMVDWKPIPSTVDALELLPYESRLPGPLPPSFRAWLAGVHTLGIVNAMGALPAVPPREPLNPVREVMRRYVELLDAGYLAFVEHVDGPLCFDLGDRDSDGDCAVVDFDLLDLEGLDRSRWSDRKVVGPLARARFPSFRSLLQAVLAR